jgi:hypothetical protein
MMEAVVTPGLNREWSLLDLLCTGSAFLLIGSDDWILVYQTGDTKQADLMVLGSWSWCESWTVQISE